MNILLAFPSLGKHNIDMEEILIWRTAQGWMAIHPLMPYEVIPTAFTADAAEEVVVAELSRLNPEYYVEVAR